MSLDRLTYGTRNAPSFAISATGACLRIIVAHRQTGAISRVLGEADASEKRAQARIRSLLATALQGVFVALASGSPEDWLVAAHVARASLVHARGIRDAHRASQTLRRGTLAEA